MNSTDNSSLACRVLATDIDGTFLPLEGDIAAVKAMEQIRDQTDTGLIPLVFVTGRHLDSVFDAIAVDGLPQPDWIMCDVGTSIYRRLAGAKSGSSTKASLKAAYSRVRPYDEKLAAIGGDAPIETHRLAIGQLPEIDLQESVKQGRHKLSYYVPAEKLDQCRQRVEQYLRDHSLKFGIISSVDPFNNDGLVDVLPNGVSKAFALHWWCEQNQVQPAEIVFCGDSGNDFAALVGGYRAVVVGNAARPLATNVMQAHTANGWKDRSFLASGTSTAGVLEGMRWFGLMPEDPTKTNACGDQLPPARNMSLRHHRWGARLIGHRRTQFNLYAPDHERMVVRLFGDTPRWIEMEPVRNGWHQVMAEECPAGTRYQFSPGRRSSNVNDHPPTFTIPDPASRSQPDGVHGASEVVDPAYSWQHDASPRAQSCEDLIIYELHIGAFTEKGTFVAAIDRLAELAELGVTAIELMPIAECPGRWNWGYDATHWFAPMHTFGTPLEMRAFVDAAHSLGLLVFADVVYNHFGPEGNYWSLLGDYLSKKHTTPWGAAPNFDEGDCQSVIREFVIDNAIYWLDEFHLDGLRVDAIHCMADDSDEHITVQFGREVRQWADAAQRRIWLIAESNVYDANMLRDLNDGGTGFDAQWCDDFAHSLFAVVRPGERLTVRTYEPGDDFAGALKRGFLFQGDVRGDRGREEDVPDQRVDSSGLIYCIQNHDFIGNHPTGHRFHHVTSVEAQAAAAATLILSPAIPMLFMGEEFACENPFAFFVDFGDDALKQAVVDGRRREYPQHDWSDGVLPTDRVAFDSAKIGSMENGNQTLRTWYRDLIALRHEVIRSGLLDGNHLNVHCDVESRLYVLWYRHRSQQLIVATRLAPIGETPHGDLATMAARLLEPDAELGLPKRDSLQAIGSASGCQTLIWW